MSTAERQEHDGEDPPAAGTMGKDDRNDRISAIQRCMAYRVRIFPILPAKPILPIRVPALDERLHADNPYELPRSAISPP
jgi:hypothetical protein